MKKVFLVALTIVVILGIGQGLLKLPAVQDVVVERGTAAVAERASVGLSESSSLRVFVCGSASPLGMGQARACLAVVTPEHFYLIDSGAGSTDNINRMALPTNRLQGLLITHFHSDHISEIYEVNLGSWVSGRPTPLTVFGPTGVDEIVSGVNATYRLDRIYRTGHHGDAFGQCQRGG